MVSQKLTECESMSEYVSKICNASNKLVSIGFKQDSKIIGGIFLMGLTSDFDAFKMAFRAGGLEINEENVKNRLLEYSVNKQHNIAYSAQHTKCGKCGKTNHKTENCFSGKKKKKFFKKASASKESGLHALGSVVEELNKIGVCLKSEVSCNEW
jgi:hypothetical protein